MPTQIRAIRKARQMTLQQLADLVKTSPQTIQRLETGAMSVSVTWLERIATALDLTPADLLVSGPRTLRVTLLSEPTASIDASDENSGAADTLGFSDTSVYHVASTLGDTTELEVPLYYDNSIAVRIKTAVGPYPAFTILIARMIAIDVAVTFDCDCLVAYRTGEVVLLRATQRADVGMTFTAYDATPVTASAADIEWFAPIYGTVRSDMTDI
jgi:transcriptional regulator with XRE-family HTH domain